MKIRIDMEPGLPDTEVVIRCAQVDDAVLKIQKAVAEIAARQEKMVLYKGETEYYLPIGEILFFETSDGKISAHTANDMFQVKKRLYELENTLPSNFMRVSKSTILNKDHIFSVTHNLTSTSVVEFSNTHKQVYVSRYYFKALKASLEEWRI